MIDIPDTIFPKDSNGEPICPGCQKTIAECSCPSFDPAVPRDVSATIRIDKSGRKGKIVTVIEGLPPEKNYLKSLCKELKIKCASGGTFSFSGELGAIEIQGHKEAQVKDILLSKGIDIGTVGQD